MEEYKLFDAEYRLMELVWNNLLSNAIKFTEHGGKVTVRQDHSRGVMWKFLYSDTGCGMSRESIRHYF